MATISLDLAAARRLILAAQDVLAQHDGAVVDVDYDRGRTRKQGPSAERNHQAAIARDLLRLSELLSAAAGEVSLKYWAFKGFDDPRSAQ